MNVREIVRFGDYAYDTEAEGRYRPRRQIRLKTFAIGTFFIVFPLLEVVYSTTELCESYNFSIYRSLPLVQWSMVLLPVLLLALSGSLFLLRFWYSRRRPTCSQCGESMLRIHRPLTNATRHEIGQHRGLHGHERLVFQVINGPRDTQFHYSLCRELFVCHECRRFFVSDERHPLPLETPARVKAKIEDYDRLERSRASVLACEQKAKKRRRP